MSNVYTKDLSLTEVAELDEKIKTFLAWLDEKEQILLTNFYEDLVKMCQEDSDKYKARPLHKRIFATNHAGKLLKDLLKIDCFHSLSGASHFTYFSFIPFADEWKKDLFKLHDNIINILNTTKREMKDIRGATCDIPQDRKEKTEHFHFSSMGQVDRFNIVFFEQYEDMYIRYLSKRERYLSGDKDE